MSATPSAEFELNAVNRKKQADLNETRELATRAFSVESIQRLQRPDLLTLQRVLQHGEEFGIWVTPPEWEPHGSARAMLSIDLRRRIEHHLLLQLAESNSDRSSAILDQWLDQAVLTLTRYLVLLRMGPAGLYSRKIYRPLDPNTITDIAYGVGPALLACAIAKKTSAHIPEVAATNDESSEPSILDSVQLNDLGHLTKSTRRRALLECQRMRVLSELDLWWDVPSLDKASSVQALIGPPRTNEEPAERSPHLPLPDEYVAEMASKSLWIAQDLAPNVLAIAEKMAELWERTSTQLHAGRTVRDKRHDALQDLLDTHDWVDCDGRPFKAPPFFVQLTRPTGFAAAQRAQTGDHDFRWPPKNHRDVLGLLSTIQLAHYFFVALSTGARTSEILGLQRDCVWYAPDNRAYVRGKTYKLVQRHDGEWRDWLLPDIVSHAVEQQVRLVSLAERIAFIDPSCAPPLTPKDGRNHLWSQLSGGIASDARQPLRHINLRLRRYAHTLRMEETPGGQNLRSHRFRKTLARLVALSLTQAPKLLMDVFGHKSIEMTLYYILTDKDLRAEIETVSRELRVMRAKEVVEKMVDADLDCQRNAEAGGLNGYGGLAAISIHAAVATHRQHVHRRGSDWNAESAIELAELLTLQGKAWDQVRAGILCTKLPGESGPCNKRKGRPEPSRCQSSCAHRLEEAFLREDVDSSIRYAIDAYAHATLAEQPLTAEHWAAQIRENLPRFPDVQQKWMGHPTVQALTSSEDAKVTE